MDIYKLKIGKMQKYIKNIPSNMHKKLIKNASKTSQYNSDYTDAYTYDPYYYGKDTSSLSSADYSTSKSSKSSLVSEEKIDESEYNYNSSITSESTTVAEKSPPKSKLNLIPSPPSHPPPVPTSSYLAASGRKTNTHKKVSKKISNHEFEEKNNYSNNYSSDNKLFQSDHTEFTLVCDKNIDANVRGNKRIAKREMATASMANKYTIKQKNSK